MTHPGIELPPYAATLFDPYRYQGLYGGRGAARSWTFARLGLILAAESQKRLLCCREIQNSIRDSVHRLLVDQIGLMLLGGFRVTDREIRHEPTGSLFAFEGLYRNVNKIKSYEGIDYAWVEEAEKVSDDSWKILIPTIRKDGSQIWLNFNPDLETDPTYQRFVINTPPNSNIQKVCWKDNPWFPEVLRTEMEYLYKVDPDAADHVWGGEIRQNSDAQILHGKWRVEAFEPMEHWLGPYQGADWGFSQHPTTLGRCWIADNRLYIEYEAYQIKLDVGHPTSQFFEQIPFARNHIIRADNARPETISLMRQGDTENDPPSWKGWNIVAAMKWPGSVEDGIAFLRKFEEIIIHPRCVHAIQEAKLYSYRVDPITGDISRVIVKQHDHIWDGIRYALAPLIRKRLWKPVI